MAKYAKIGTVWVWSALWVVAACDALGSAEVQPLPPLERPSPEFRLGLPEVQGRWQFAGWALSTPDTVAARGGLATPGQILIATQRLDSVAGAYTAGAERLPLVGEVRRDSVVALVAAAAGQGWFLAGRLRGDTLWIELTSLPAAQSWPPGTHGAFLRDSIDAPFVRLPDGALLATEPDTLPSVPDSFVRPAPPPPDSAPAAVPAPARTPPPDSTPRPDTVRSDTARSAPLPQARPRRAPPPERDTTSAGDTARTPPLRPDTMPTLPSFGSSPAG